MWVLYYCGGPLSLDILGLFYGWYSGHCMPQCNAMPLNQPIRFYSISFDWKGKSWNQILNQIENLCQYKSLKSSWEFLAVQTFGVTYLSLLSLPTASLNCLTPYDTSLTLLDSFLTPSDNFLTPYDTFLIPSDNFLKLSDTFLTPLSTHHWHPMTHPSHYLTPLWHHLTHSWLYITPSWQHLTPSWHHMTHSCP